MPRVSVVIATYNWSAALRCALRSVQMQTYSDFEVMVVGDACTDDSADVVESFRDSRFRWLNRETNAGSQWAPNNDGIARSSGEYIAYLGHDDLWHPEHIESLVRALDSERADLAAAVCVIHGPSDSGIRSISGVFPEGEYTPDQHFSPSSMMHSRAIVDRAGGWRDPASTAIWFDYEFVARMCAAGAKVVATGEMTSFKFSASQRRNVYRTKCVNDQLNMLAKLESGIDFRSGEYREIVRSFLSGRFIDLRIPAATADSYRQFRDIRRFKGADTNELEATVVTGVKRFFISPDFAFLEWHAPERNALFGPFRWSGPGTRATFVVPGLVPPGATIRVHILEAAFDDFASMLSMEVGGETVPFSCRRTELKTFVLTAEAPASGVRHSRGGTEVTFALSRTRLRPMANGGAVRRVGIAVNYVEIESRTG